MDYLVAVADALAFHELPIILSSGMMLNGLESPSPCGGR